MGRCGLAALSHKPTFLALATNTHSAGQVTNGAYLLLLGANNDLNQACDLRGSYVPYDAWCSVDLSCIKSRHDVAIEHYSILDFEFFTERCGNSRYAVFFYGRGSIRHSIDSLLSLWMG
jgi:hypothetical protein